MWSLGAILFELLNGYPPFRGSSSVQVIAFSHCKGLPLFVNPPSSMFMFFKNRYCRISSHLYVFLSLSRFFLSCTLIVLTYAPDYCLSIQVRGFVYCMICIPFLPPLNLTNLLVPAENRISFQEFFQHDFLKIDERGR